MTTLVEETDGEKKEEEELVVTVCESLSGLVRCLYLYCMKL